MRVPVWRSSGGRRGPGRARRGRRAASAARSRGRAGRESEGTWVPQRIVAGLSSCVFIVTPRTGDHTKNPTSARRFARLPRARRPGGFARPARSRAERSAAHWRFASRNRRVRAGDVGVTRGSGGLAYQSALYLRSRASPSRSQEKRGFFSSFWNTRPGGVGPGFGHQTADRDGADALLAQVGGDDLPVDPPSDEVGCGERLLGDGVVDIEAEAVFGVVDEGDAARVRPFLGQRRQVRFGPRAGLAAASS